MAKSYYECIEAIDAQAARIHGRCGAPEEGVVGEVALSSGLAEGRLRMTPAGEDALTNFDVINFMTSSRDGRAELYSYSVFPGRLLAIAQFDGIRLPKNEIRKALPEEDEYARAHIAAGARLSPIRALTLTGLRRLVDDFETFTQKVLLNRYHITGAG